MYNNRGRGTGYLRKMFAQNRRMMTNLLDCDMGMQPMMRNGNYPRRGRMQMQNNFGPNRPFRPQGKQIPAKSNRSNDQCFEFGVKGNYSTNYAQHQMNGTSKFSQGPHYKLLPHETVRHAPYRVPVQNRQQQPQSDGFSDKVQLYTQRSRATNEPKTGLRKIWRIESKNKPDPKVALVEPVKSVGDLGATGISNFLSPSPWFPGTKNLESSNEKNGSVKSYVLKYDRFDETYNEQDNKQNSYAGNLNTSSNTIRNDNKANYEDDPYPDDVMEIENPLKKKWPAPPGLSKNINSEEFYAKVCEAVLAKVLEQLCPNPYKADPKLGAKSRYNTQPQPNRTFNFEKKNVTNCSADNSHREINHFARPKPFQNREIAAVPKNNPPQRKIPALMACNFNKNDYKKFAPKPMFNRSFNGRGRGTGRVTKPKISTKKQESLV